MFPYLDYQTFDSPDNDVDDVSEKCLQSCATSIVRRYASAADLHLAPLPSATPSSDSAPTTGVDLSNPRGTNADIACSPLTRGLRKLNIRLVDLPEDCLLPTTLNRPVASRLMRQLRSSPSALSPTTTTNGYSNGDLRVNVEDLQNSDGEGNAFGFTCDEALALASYLRSSLVSLDGVPLCVRASGTVGRFPPQSTVLYAHRYAHLLPDSREKFAHAGLENAIGTANLRTCLTPFDVGAFASLLDEHLPSTVYCSRLKDYFVWEAKAREQTLTDEWASAVWTYLAGLADGQVDGVKEEDGSATSNRKGFFNSGSLRSISVKSPLSPVKSPLSPVKSPVKSPLKSPRLSNSGSPAIRDINLLDDWYIIPAIQQRGNTKVTIIFPI